MITTSPASAVCPACGRYAGTLTCCPYCDLRIPRSPALHIIKAAAFLFAVAGLFILWQGTARLSPGLLRTDLGLPPIPVSALPPFIAILIPHLHWMLWCAIVFMLMSERPGPTYAGQAGWRRFFSTSRPTAIGLLVFLLSGLLGCLLLYRFPPGSTGTALPRLLPALAGLGPLPWLLFNPAPRLQPWHPARTGGGWHRWCSVAALIGIGMLVAMGAGVAGLTVMLTAAGIGTLPLLYESRRLSTIGVVLLPLACNLSGAGLALAVLLGLR